MIADRTIDVQKQRNLAFRRTVGLCFKGITHRLLRSVLTLAVVALAVAFFMFLLSENAFLAAVGAGVHQEAETHRYAQQLLNRVYGQATPVGMARRLVQAWPADDAALREFARVTGWQVGRVTRLAELSVREEDLLEFFARLTPGKRALLVQRRKERDILRHLADAAARQAFIAASARLSDVRLPGGVEAFESFLADYPQHEAERDAFTAAWQAAVQRATEATRGLTGGQAVEPWLAGVDDASLAAWAAALRGQGFEVPADRLPLVRGQLDASVRRQSIVQALNAADKQNQWRVVFQERRRLSTEEKVLRLDDDRVVSLLDNAYTRPQLAAVAEVAARELRLAGLEQRLAGKVEMGRGNRGMGGRQLFLLLISFVVCMVGIANAMLMSITERFREIATMKCLGATDHFIMVQFMLEAALQGIAGSLLGVALGFVAALVKAALLYGAPVFACWPGAGLAAAGLVSLFAGVLLAVLASVYPSWLASRMAPMEAMRVE